MYKLLFQLERILNKVSTLLLRGSFKKFGNKSIINDIEEWDSLASVRVMLKLQKTIKKKLSLSKIAKFQKVKDLYEYTIQS